MLCAIRPICALVSLIANYQFTIPPEPHVSHPVLSRTEVLRRVTVHFTLSVQISITLCALVADFQPNEVTEKVTKRNYRESMRALISIVRMLLLRVVLRSPSLVLSSIDKNTHFGNPTINPCIFDLSSGAGYGIRRGSTAYKALKVILGHDGSS